MERLLGFRATRTVSRNLFWILVPQERSHGTNFGFSCHKNCLTEPLLGFRATRTVSWIGFWMLVPKDLSHGTTFGFSCRKTHKTPFILNTTLNYPFKL